MVEADHQHKIISCTGDQCNVSEYLKKFMEIVKCLRIEDTALRHGNYHTENGVVVGALEDFDHPEKCPHILLKPYIKELEAKYNCVIEVGR